jgi:uncharacterized membrane protein
VTTSQWLLMLHITAAFFLVSGSVAAGILNALSIRAERPSETAYLLRLVRVTLPVIYIGVAGTLIFGLWLWHELDFGFGEFWIWASLVLWVAANALGGIGGRHQERLRERAEELASSGDTATPEFRAMLRDPKANAMSWLAGAAVVGILVLMIWRPGA